MEKIINLLKMNFCKKESMSKKSSLETYKSYTLNLEIMNLSEVIKFMSPIVDINHFIHGFQKKKSIYRNP